MSYENTRFELTGKVALVAGAAGGMDKAITARLTAAGAFVVMADMAAQPMPDAAQSRFIALDVTQEDDWIEAIADIMAKEGRLDILVNNTGILRKDMITDSDVAMFNGVVAVNQLSTSLGMKHAAP